MNMDGEDTERLLPDELAAQWLVRLETASPKEHAEFQRWLSESPLHVREALLAAATRLLLTHLLRNGSIDPNAFLTQTSNVHQIGSADRTATEHQTPSFAPFSCWARPTAALATRKKLMIVAGTALIALFAVVTLAIQVVTHDSSIVTGPGEWRTKVLNDGTILHAGPRTTVNVAFTDGQRIVRLIRGEALFEVAKDSQRPFLVQNELATARAVGTAFAVSLENPEQLRVTVKEGIVAVIPRSHSRSRQRRANTTRPSLELRAGEQVDVTEANPLNIEHVSVDSALAWARGQLVFEHETIEQAAREFNRRNEIQIKVADQRLAARAVRGTFAATDPEAFTAQLEKLGAVVKEANGTLIVATPRRR
jgi:transmembrane sensor